MRSGLAGQAEGVQAFVGVLLGAFVIQAPLPHGGDDDPVAGQIDGGAIRLVHGGRAPPGKRAVHRIAGSLVFEDRHELLLALLEAAQDGIGDLAVRLDVPFPGEGEGVWRFGGSGVAQQAAKDVGEEIRQQGRFPEVVRAAGGDESGPVLEFGLPVPHGFRQGEGPHLLADHFGVEERFGFERHLPGDKTRRHPEKTNNIEHPTTNIQRPKPLQRAKVPGRRFG